MDSKAQQIAIATYIGLPSKIHESYTFLLSLLQDLGLEVSYSKLVPPSTCVTNLGIQVDTVHKTNEKLQEIKMLCKHGHIRNFVLNNNFNPY